jgi:predicted DNA-binding protein (MmcQ/YjbR family)
MSKRAKAKPRPAKRSATKRVTARRATGKRGATTRVARKGEPEAGSAALARMRAVCLAFPESSEASSWNHPNFRAGKKTFAAFEIVRGRPSIAFRLDPADVAALLRRREFFETPYGRGQWASAWADVPLDLALVEELLLRSYRVVANRRMLLALEGAPRRP